MKNIIDTVHCFTTIFHVSNIAYDQFERFRIVFNQGKQVLQMPRRKIVQTNYRSASLQKHITQIRADKTGSASY